MTWEGLIIVALAIVLGYAVRDAIVKGTGK